MKKNIFLTLLLLLPTLLFGQTKRVQVLADSTFYRKAIVRVDTLQIQPGPTITGYFIDSNGNLVLTGVDLSIVADSVFISEFLQVGVGANIPLIVSTTGVIGGYFSGSTGTFSGDIADKY